MFDYSFELSKTQEAERAKLSLLKARWFSLNESQRQQITKSIEQLKSHGAICSEYDFI